MDHARGPAWSLGIRSPLPKRCPMHPRLKRCNQVLRIVQARACLPELLCLGWHRREMNLLTRACRAHPRRWPRLILRREPNVHPRAWCKRPRPPRAMPPKQLRRKAPPRAHANSQALAWRTVLPLPRPRHRRSVLRPQRHPPRLRQLLLRASLLSGAACRTARPQLIHHRPQLLPHRAIRPRRARPRPCPAPQHQTIRLPAGRSLLTPHHPTARLGLLPRLRATRRQQPRLRAGRCLPTTLRLNPRPAARRLPRQACPLPAPLQAGLCPAIRHLPAPPQPLRPRLK